MTDEKILEVLDLYDWFLIQSSTVRRMGDSHGQARDREHLIQMIPQMREFVAEGRREKVMRWIGFMQGAFWAYELFSIEELMAHNKPYDEEFDENA